ncbi:MAG TPA: hypothetical protein VHY37_07945 [Tepidisphaeraceae bacterium]|jgi:hypothetical protein|nr:hypothetical protein [Tepidisphaeraceae bacterium]
MRSRLLMYATLFGLASMLIGCAQPMTPVDFHAPAGSTLSMAGKTFNLPAVVPLPRPGRPGDEEHSTVNFTFPGPDHQIINAAGALTTYGYDVTDLDRLSDNPCDITDAQIGQLLDGYAIEFKGTSASKQPIFHLIIGKPK